MSSLKRIVDSYMLKVSGLEEHCNRCLKTERWGGSVVLMVVDAAFTSIGLNYFTAVVPKVEEFNKKFVENGKIMNLRELAQADISELRLVWKNKRSWIKAFFIDETGRAEVQVNDLQGFNILDVKYNHSKREFGKDITFSEIDKFGYGVFNGSPS